MEHVSGGGDGQQSQIPAIKAGGWEIFSSRAVKNITQAMELYWLAATALGMSVWEMVGGGKREWIAAAPGHRFPATGTG